MRARQVDGVITATARLDHDVLDEMAAAGLPIVLVNRRLEDGALSVGHGRRPRGRAAGRRSTSSRSATRAIAHLGGPQEVSTGHARYEGFMAGDGRRRASRSTSALVRFGRSFTEPEGERLCRELLDADAPDRDRRRQRPDGARLLRRLRRARHPLPAATSRSSASTTCRSRSASTRRSRTVGIPHYEIGSSAAELLLDRLQRPDAPARHVVLAPAARRCVNRRRPSGLDNRAGSAIRLQTFAAIVCRRRRRRHDGAAEDTLVRYR